MKKKSETAPPAEAAFPQAEATGLRRRAGKLSAVAPTPNQVSVKQDGRSEKGRDPESDPFAWSSCQPPSLSRESQSRTQTFISEPLSATGNEFAEELASKPVDSRVRSSEPEPTSGKSRRAEERKDLPSSPQNPSSSSPSSSFSSSESSASAVHRLFIEVTPEIRSFLEKTGADTAREFKTRTAIDLDRLMELVTKYNENRPKGLAQVRVSDLVEKSYIVGKVSPTPAVNVDDLPASERFRLLSEERKYRATVRKLFGTKEEDVFANYTQSMALGVNALMGLFLMFLAGYWMAEYSGVRDFTTKVIVGVICSFGCLLVEVGLLLIHDEVLQRKSRRRVVARPTGKPS
ncbi:endoplasmic reticulum-based factor for assembly of V-ATPase [Toxoplasma gondii GAB2-2007-GAL-DOM2]|uniref:Endoplasmic reticulum-based factor for assembly of V-ATPase n=9 Tax=Toxoplasma gondii TaxID=5811 RepID=S7VW20_TOXGG|nr:hypothetical protein TGGT1_267510 [Toxoplasma gondii GT1]KAF4644063.1 hypothetical protein TGRH88_010610 [Toxoplasma gondii]KFG29734.1 endoplasmic reticulum-based factor for assembly of V-ATPase [Toxoplasma gondii p89]KFG38869.1 endoplasmic reticulum-based factor for assembly of V-ATPase [Toxoplasma gondii GAB2-2007-GAL-DOM2]KFG42929.1 endoplasmic reticulum-based factor for assembly of V-ATPase [Toxoplasma gondii FOU]KFH01725.1 endoplasmic reticulum-based factor for assembly of V-ATPase [To